MTRSRRTRPYQSWQDFLARAAHADRMRWCALKAKVANRRRLMSGSPDTRITAQDVWTVLAKARGHCSFCGSLALERRPTDPRTGAPRPWELMGRRIGSLEHIRPRLKRGTNGAANLVWACLWCNTWETERIKGARDHGGFFPAGSRGLRRLLGKERRPKPPTPQQLSEAFKRVTVALRRYSHKPRS